MMFNDDHILVPGLDIVPAYRYTQKILHVYPMWPVWVCNSSHNQMESSILPQPISTYIILRALTMEFLVLEIL